MITEIKNADDAMSALAENFNRLVTGRRKMMEAKEVTNNIGKMINLAKVQVVEKLRIGDKEPLDWLLPPTRKLLENSKIQ